MAPHPFRILQTSVAAFLALLLCTSELSAQTAVVTKNVNLRPDSSTEKASIRLLKPPTALQLLDPNPEDGYYNVRTIEGQEGWVWGKNVKIDTAFSPAAAAIASVISETWEKPPAKGGTFTAESGSCGWAGVGEEKESNRLKNRTDIPTSFHDVTFSSIATLPVPVGPKHRTDWSETLREDFEKFEGIPVRVVGFLVAVKPQTGSEEAANCKFKKAAETDWHVALVANAGDGEHDAVVVETTPAFARTIRNGRRGGSRLGRTPISRCGSALRALEIGDSLRLVVRRGLNPLT